MPVRGQGDPVGPLAPVAALAAIALPALVDVEEADPALSGEDREQAAKAADVRRKRIGDLVIDFER